MQSPGASQKQRRRTEMLLPLALAGARRAATARAAAAAVSKRGSLSSISMPSTTTSNGNVGIVRLPFSTLFRPLHRPMFAASASLSSAAPFSTRNNEMHVDRARTAAKIPSTASRRAVKNSAAVIAATPSHCSGCGVSLQGIDPNAPGYFQMPKPKKEKDSSSGGGAEEEVSAASAAVLFRDDEASSSDDEEEEDEDDDLAAAAATAALFDASDSVDGVGSQEDEEGIEEIDLSDFDDDELDLDAAALGYEFKDDARVVEGDDGGGELDDAKLARAVSRALVAAANASSLTSAPPSSSTGQEQEQDIDAALSAFDAAIDSWDLGGSKRGGFDFDEDDFADDEEDDVSFLLDIEDEEEEDEEGEEGSSLARKPLCARCYSLTHYGKVKNAAAEAALPSFDLAGVVGRKLALTKFRRQVVLVVVDVADFDGSLPRAELREMLPDIGGDDDESGFGSFDDRRRGPRNDSSAPKVSLVFAVNKADTLPSAATSTRVADWARRRARSAGVRRPDAVHVVSAKQGTGVRQLLADLHARLAGRGDVWVVGSQNAGKSSLLNAMKREVATWKGGGVEKASSGRTKKKRAETVDAAIKDPITAAPLPGTTLGVLRVRGLLPRGCKMLDTPGAPSPRSVIARLQERAAAAVSAESSPSVEVAAAAAAAAASAAEDASMLLPRSRISPRTFRASAGQSLLVGGIARVDVVTPPSSGGATLYLTVWAASPVGVHYGSTGGATRARASLVARGTLSPPLLPSVGERKDKAEEAASMLSSTTSSSSSMGPVSKETEASASALLDEALGIGTLVPVEVRVCGESWRRSSTDVAVAGLGWISVALVGDATLRVWAPKGVAVTVREALVPDLARELGRPGFNGLAGSGSNAAAEASGKKAKKRGGGGGGGKKKRN